MSFAEDFDKLTAGEKNQFTDTVDELLFHCYVVRKKYDRTTGMDKISYDYSFIERHFSLFEDYLGYMGMTLSKDDDSGVIFLRSDEDKNRQHVDTSTTLVVYALRIYYEEQISKVPNVLEVAMDSNQLRQELSDLGLTTASKRLTLQTVSSAMRDLASFNVIARGKGSFNDPTYSFYILPSIRFVISNDKLNALYRYLTGAEGAEGEPFGNGEDSASDEEGKDVLTAKETDQGPAPTGF